MTAPQPPHLRVVRLRRLAAAALIGCGLVLACLNPRPDDFPSSRDVSPGDEPAVVAPPSAPTCDENPVLAICQDGEAEGGPVDANGNDPGVPGNDDGDSLEEPPDAGAADAGAADAGAPDAGDAQPRL
jgi:hypothetical protein